MESSMSRMALDNLIRRELKVSDPNDPKQVAQALLSRYKDNPRAVSIAREAEGMPFLLAPSTAPMVQQAATSSDTEMQQAIDDVERDLQELTTNTILKDIKVELEGWAAAIRSSIREGVMAARFGLDTRKRDITFGIRRNLGDYARLARLIGALTPALNINYRKLAQSLDEVAAVLLVMMGEALANVGFSGGKYLLQVPYSELQIRRDAAIYALRNLTGSVQEAYGSSDWQRGLDAYRQLSDGLETYAQGDLRALLVENELIRIMDNLIQRTGQGGVEGLRQLGVTAKVDIERLRRLVIVGFRIVNPPSPPLTAFLDSLQLFVDAFRNAGGYRLLHVARPPILFYGLYGQSTPGDSSPEKSIVDLIIQRGLLAEQLDRFSQVGSGARVAKGQIILDKLLYDIDRAIDLYAVGRALFGEPEYRAAAYSYVIDVVTSVSPDFLGDDNTPLTNLLQELTNAYGSTSSSSLTPISFRFQEIQARLTTIRDLLFRPLGDYLGLVLEENSQFLPSFDNMAEPTEDQSRTIDFIQQELFIQKDMEQGWKDLVETMAPNYVPYTEVVGEGGVIAELIDAAIERTGSYENPAVRIPRDPASSWDEIARDGIRIRRRNR